MPPILKLQGFHFTELFKAQGLKRLDDAFLTLLKEKDLTLYHDLIDYREEQKAFSTLETSTVLLNAAVHLEEFLIQLFDIEEAAWAAKAKTVAENPVAAFKKFYVLRKAKKLASNPSGLLEWDELNSWLEEALNHATVTPLPVKNALGDSRLKHPGMTESEATPDIKELAVALLGNSYLENTETYAAQIEKLTQWCAHALITPKAKEIVKNWTSFRLPERLDYNQLIRYTTSNDKWERITVSDHDLRLRDGFKLTDPRMNTREVQDEVNYCIYCHDHDGDFCGKGFPVKKGDPTLGFKKNPLDITLTGCPLEEKISEMNILKRDGFTLASLAMVMVDNPMCPATGHRICNDCMKACIYQKQEPVNIPQIETRVLTDVLNLPWGVEIYDLLTRWNPLRQKQWIMKPYNGLKVMIAGMGPAGFTLAHHLLLEGFAVVGFDGLKIEPLPEKWLNVPIYQYNELIESLDERLMAGFGGVAEYGITVRWDKNFLKLIYISLMRKPYFQVFGSVRFGGTVKIEDAWEMGFDHFAIAVGAGLPKALPIPGSLAPGMRQANDFLMALQLGNAAKASSLTNIQVRLPAVVIGGGLTGVDTATEVQAYYIQQVEKIMTRYEKLCDIYSEEQILMDLDIASREILDEFLVHGRAVTKERADALSEKRQPNFIKLIRAWGGVTIVYRRRLNDSPAYTHNHEELQKALAEGIYYLEKVEPAAVNLNQFGHVETLVCHRRILDEKNNWETLQDELHLPARSIFVATGTQPNIAYEFEHKGTFNRLGFQYQHYEDVDDKLTVSHGVEHCKDPDFGPFTSYHRQDKRVSLIGDTHPVFHGSVVKAIASGLRTYPKILAVLKDRLHQEGDDNEYQQFAKTMTHQFQSKVVSIKPLSDTILELIIHSPLAAKHYQPGQFYRLQNYETYAAKMAGTVLQMEPLALIAANADSQKGHLKFLVIESGASSKLCRLLSENEPVSLMGPTGVRAKISHERETVLIAGGQLSLAMLESYGSALRASGNRVIYLGTFKNKNDVFNQKAVEALADVIIWNTEEPDLIIPGRNKDVSFSGNPIDALHHYAKNHPAISLNDVDRIYLIAPTDFLRAFQAARSTMFKDDFVKQPKIFGSVFSTMQCMLKGVCAQCLQWQIDPETGKRTKAVFACSWPEQPLELIDFDNIDERQVQNKLQEQLSERWVDYLLTLTN